MKDLAEMLNNSIDESTDFKRDPFMLLEEKITQALIDIWDNYGIEYTHKDVKEWLDRLAKDYNIDKHIDWAKKYIK